MTEASPAEDEPLRRRRSLSHVGGTVETAGDRAEADRLAWALDVVPATDAEDDPARPHIHGFHTYPARIHPTTAARLISAFVPPGSSILDPFCGSGTVLVEAMLAGRRPLGTDLNPLAVRLARCKTYPHGPVERDQLVAMARKAQEDADARRKGKAGATRRFPIEDVELFEPHVLLELDSLRAFIESLPESGARLDLSLVLSAVLVKLSRKKGDTSSGTRQRRTAAGFPAKLFLRKAEDLATRLGQFAALLPPSPPVAFVAQDDATVLRSLPPGGVSAIVTSPPYAATYDYVAHHALRMRWLSMDPMPLARGEIGSRSAYRKIAPAEARSAWMKELGRFITAAGKVLPPGGPLVLVIADSAVGNVALRAESIVADVARECGFVPAARASQLRPHFHGPTLAAFRSRPRAEHAIVLRKSR